ncbi:hypothetical protein [Microvirga rosea]|uniref:hypothetical protein n=1 Tax=Microvirga rosea TaxID=2715425 RepID=UPI001D0B91DE|nr:hypothetical protein [Microvirga rosea]MCB8820502.1 hypothetical protein [Microvirga rosea]
MTDLTEVKGSRRSAGSLSRLHEAHVLHARIKGLKALLQLQKSQVEKLNDQLYSDTPAGTAARRLLDLKRSKMP